MKSTLLLLTVLLFTSCGTDPLDGKYVQDEYGNIYRVTDKLGSLVFLDKINERALPSEKLKEVAKLDSLLQRAK